jgi:hypothetical protein
MAKILYIIHTFLYTIAPGGGQRMHIIYKVTASEPPQDLVNSTAYHPPGSQMVSLLLWLHSAGR